MPQPQGDRIYSHFAAGPVLFQRQDFAYSALFRCPEPARPTDSWTGTTANPLWCSVEHSPVPTASGICHPQPQLASVPRCLRLVLTSPLPLRSPPPSLLIPSPEPLPSVVWFQPCIPITCSDCDDRPGQPWNSLFRPRRERLEPRIADRPPTPDPTDVFQPGNFLLQARLDDARLLALAVVSCILLLCLSSLALLRVVWPGSCRFQWQWCLPTSKCREPGTGLCMGLSDELVHLVLIIELRYTCLGSSYRTVSQARSSLYLLPGSFAMPTLWSNLHGPLRHLTWFSSAQSPVTWGRSTSLVDLR